MEQIKFPEMPVVFGIGSAGMESYTCTFEESQYTPSLFTHGTFLLTRHQYGIELNQTFKPLYIHPMQVQKVTLENSETIKNKSVIGRAAVGAILAGPVGAIVGGMSGIGKKEKRLYLLMIDYYDVYSHELKSILITSKKDLTPIANFLNPEFKAVGKANFICNLKDSEGRLSDERIIEASNKVGLNVVRKELTKYGRTKEWINEKLASIAPQVSQEPTIKKSGCAGILLLLILSSALLFLP